MDNRRPSQSSEASAGSYTHYAEEASYEQFSGPISESVPSSYSSFHHRRWQEPRQERQEGLSRSSSQQSLETFGGRKRSDSLSSFKFFTQDEIEQADGTSSAHDIDPMDYENMIEEGYEDESIFPNPHQHPSRYSYENRYSIDEDNWYSTEEPSGGGRRYHRRSSLSENTEDPLLLDEETGDFGQVAYHYRHWYTYPSERAQQRFYISEEDIMVFFGGYKTSRLRLGLYYFLCWISFGIAYLILRWVPRWRIACIGDSAAFGECDWIVIENQWGELSIIDVECCRFHRQLSTVFNIEKAEEDEEENFDPDPMMHSLRWFEYRYIKFIYNPVEDMFNTNQTWVDQHWNVASREGLDSDTVEERELVFGPNVINIEEKPTIKLLVDEVLHPFYVFQVFSIILWAFDEYYYYAGCIFLISVISVGNTLVETKQTLNRLRNISKFTCNVRVLRNSFWKTIPSTELVPGDVYEVSDPDLTLLPCDSILLSGDCIVNESMLTGESVPVSKLPATDQTFGQMLQRQPGQGVNVSAEVSRNYLYSGTKIIRVRRPIGNKEEAGDDDNNEDDNEGDSNNSNKSDRDEFDVALAMAVKTGFLTTKGALVRSMLFPKPSGFKFYQDSFKYIGVMACIAIFGFIISTVNFIRMGIPVRLIVLRALDLITIVVPPALPATLTIGTNISLSRLKKKNIFCISPNRVNVGGKLDVLCFDKTGTLTEDGLDVLGVRVINEYHQFDGMSSNLPLGLEIESILSTCHSLRVIDNELMGDPLDVKMFEFASWGFEEVEARGKNVRISTSPENIELETMKTFEFVSQLRRMSVLVRNRQDASNVRAFVKGAPESIAEICSSELPSDYLAQLQYYTHRGYRVIACASKTFHHVSSDEVEELSRDEVESDLSFVGFIIFENKLKESTSAAIRQLTDAKIRTIMCTGDNVLTAISVARECHMIKAEVPIFIPHFEDNEDILVWTNVDDDDDDAKMDNKTLIPNVSDYVLAVTGDAFRYIVQCGSQQQLEQMLMNSKIFARMSPDEKHELVEKLQDLDYTTGFCGDGANDCGALKAADVGISLSEAEASVAAPFTSRIFQISCVLDVIKEGRCALATSFSCFKYMSMYSAIQFVTVSIMYALGSNLGDFQFLWIDLFLILPIAIFMAWGKPFEVLSTKRPTANLVSRKVLLPLLGEIGIFASMQFLLWHIVKKREWYVPPIRGGDDSHVKSSDNSALFIFSCFQYVFIAIILTVGPPHRQPMFKNTPFLITVGLAVLATLGLLFSVDPSSGFADLMQLTFLSTWFKFVLLAVVVLNIIVSSFAEYAIFPLLSIALVAVKRLFGMHKTHSRKRYKNLKNSSNIEDYYDV